MSFLVAIIHISKRKKIKWKMRYAGGLFIRNKLPFQAIDELFGKCTKMIVISLIKSPNGSTHMIDKN